MIKVSIDWNKLSDEAKNAYAAWHAKVEKATSEVISKWESSYPPNPEKLLDGGLWTEYKEWLLQYVFLFKCAYCEKSVKDQKNDAEHFRPKGAVRDESAGKWDKVMVILPGGTEPVPHPGYFWLAYDPENLMPACDACNSSNETGGAAKLDKFPVQVSHLFAVPLTAAEVDAMDPKPWPSTRWSGYYYLRTSQMDEREGRKLINPMRDNPHKHLRFLPNGDIESTGTPQGDATIRVLTLDREELKRQRHFQQKSVWMQLAVTWARDDSVETLFARSQDFLQGYLDGREAFSAATLDFIVGRVNHPAFQNAIENVRR